MIPNSSHARITQVTYAPLLAYSSSHGHESSTLSGILIVGDKDVLGKAVGLLLGVFDGLWVGNLVGLTVTGLLLGDLLGNLVGLKVIGLLLGDFVGLELGLLDGFRLGRVEKLGLIEGISDGD